MYISSFKDIFILLIWKIIINSTIDPKYFKILTKLRKLKINNLYSLVKSETACRKQKNIFLIKVEWENEWKLKLKGRPAKN